MRLSSTHIVIHGASGRMGARLIALSRGCDDIVVEAAVARSAAAPSHPESATNAAHSTPIVPASSLKPGVAADVVIDFSSDEGALEALRIARRASAALLVGTTALSESTRQVLHSESRARAVIVAGNTSLGVAALVHAAAALARSLGAGYRAAIVESHHIHKKDAPSGTAIRFAAALRNAGADLPEDQVLSIRGGDVVGEHVIRFAGPGEVIELVHRATTRDLFAAGALRAARWLKGRAPGWYTIDDVARDAGGGGVVLAGADGAPGSSDGPAGRPRAS